MSVTAAASSAWSAFRPNRGLLESTIKNEGSAELLAVIAVAHLFMREPLSDLDCVLAPRHREEHNDFLFASLLSGRRSRTLSEADLKTWRPAMRFLVDTGYCPQPLRLSLLAAVLLGGCSPHFYPYTAEDTVCLNKQVYSYHLPMDRAISACGTSDPDLTGDKNLQQVAMNAGVPFRVDRYLDQKPKPTGNVVIQPGASFVPIY